MQGPDHAPTDAQSSDSPDESSAVALANAPERCVSCGAMNDNRKYDSGECSECRSPHGKIAEADLAMKLWTKFGKGKADAFNEHQDAWVAIKEHSRSLFNKDGIGPFDEKTWETALDWLQTRHAGGSREKTLRMTLAEAAYILRMEDLCPPPKPPAGFQLVQVDPVIGDDGSIRANPIAAAYGLQIDTVRLGPTLAWGNEFPVSNFDCKAVPGDTPSICPNADRKPAPAWLPNIEKRFKDMKLVKEGETIHWVGAQARPETVCSCEFGLAVEKPQALTESSGQTSSIFASEGDGYFIAGFGEQGRVRKLKGFDQIAQLIREPKQGISMAQLIGGVDDPRIVADSHSRQPVADSKTLVSLRRRLIEAEADLDKAKSENNNVEQDHCLAEIESVSDQLGQMTGIGGKPRDINNPNDKLRPTIHASLNRAYKALRECRPSMNELADHFEASISAGGGCFIYRPIGKAPSWSFDLPQKK